MNEETKSQVIEYVYNNYKSYKDKELIVEEFDNCFRVKINKDESPLILSKGIIKQIMDKDELYRKLRMIQELLDEDVREAKRELEYLIQEVHGLTTR